MITLLSVIELFNILQPKKKIIEGKYIPQDLISGFMTLKKKKENVHSEKPALTLGLS